MSAGSAVAEIDTTGGGTLSYTANNPVCTIPFEGRLVVSHIPGSSRGATFDISAYSNYFYVVDFNKAYLDGNGGINGELELNSTAASGMESFWIPESSTPFSVAVPMNSFAGINWTEAYNLVLNIRLLPPTATFEIDQIRFVSSIPEPRSLLLFTVAVCRLLTRRRNFVR